MPSQAQLKFFKNVMFCWHTLNCGKPRMSVYLGTLQLQSLSNAGLSSQLAAQAVLPALEEMRDVRVEELLRILCSREHSR